MGCTAEMMRGERRRWGWMWATEAAEEKWLYGKLWRGKADTEEMLKKC